MAASTTETGLNESDGFPSTVSMDGKMEENFTPGAKKIWQAIPTDIRLKILNNVWCVQCRGVTGIGNVSGKVESGMLVLRGICTRCGGEVARVIENE